MPYNPIQNTDDTRWPIIAREGWPIIATIGLIAAALGTGLSFLHPWAGIVAGIVGAAFVLWAFWFFRDPARTPPTDPGAVISGADGVVCFVGPGTPPPELNITPEHTRGMTRVSVFMNVFNVHVNRAPTRATVERIAYRPGMFFNAAFDKASEHNERLSILLRLSDGRAMVVVQIAGLIARRIVCRTAQGRTLAPGERFGLIRFGSRVDHYLPSGVAPCVREGDPAVAGKTVIASLIATTSSAPTDPRTDTNLREAAHA